MNAVLSPIEAAGTFNVTGNVASLLPLTITEAGVTTLAPAGPTLLVTAMLNCTAFGPALCTVTCFIALKSLNRSANPNDTLSSGMRATACVAVANCAWTRPAPSLRGE